MTLKPRHIRGFLSSAPPSRLAADTGRNPGRRRRPVGGQAVPKSLAVTRPLRMMRQGRAVPSADEKLGQFIIDVLTACGERGMQPPFIVCVASPNGSVLAVRIVGDGSPGESLAQHFEPEGFKTPITCMVIDQTGDAVRVSIKGGRAIFH